MRDCIDRVPAVVAARPELKDREPFRTVMSGERDAIATLSKRDLEAILVATLSGMSVEEFQRDVRAWLATARNPRWHKPCTELTYQPMREVLE